MKDKAKIVISKVDELRDRYELFINDKKVENVVNLTDIRNLYQNDTLKEIDITLVVSEIEIVNTRTGRTEKYPPSNATRRFLNENSQQNRNRQKRRNFKGSHRRGTP